MVDQTNEANEIRLLVEISSLGFGQNNLSYKAGIYRAVDSLLRALEQTGQSSMQFCAIHSAEQHYGALDYLEKSNVFSVSQMPHSSWRLAANRAIHSVYRNANQGRRVNQLFWRSVKRIVRRWAYLDAILTFDPAPVKCVQWANVFHSTSLRIPKQAEASPQLCRFTTVYDTIPLLFPQYFGLKSAKEHFLTEFIEAIRPDDWTICISEHTKSDLLTFRPDLDPARMPVIPLAASELFHPCLEQDRIDEVRQRYGIPAGPYLLSLSTLEPRKNLSHLIRCFCRLLLEERRNDLHLVLAGSLGWEYEPLLAEISGADSALRSKIIMTGRVEDEDMSPLYSGASAFVFPSLYEGFGLPPLEAMQCGTPVISSNSSSLPEVVGTAGLLVSPEDGDGLCQAILNVLGSETLRKDLSQRGIERAANFSWNTCADQTIAAYRTALKEKHLH